MSEPKTYDEWHKAIVVDYDYELEDAPEEFRDSISTSISERDYEIYLSNYYG